MKINILDLFAGCGGFSNGFELLHQQPIFNSSQTQLHSPHSLQVGSFIQSPIKGAGVSAFDSFSISQTNASFVFPIHEQIFGGVNRNQPLPLTDEAAGKVCYFLYNTTCIYLLYLCSGIYL